MASSVFFRFKSQKEPSRVAFDGTGISVFELKREIISMNRLGDGTDFELVISSVDTNEEYDDDTTIIPRSTTVIAKRLPAQKPGRGGAARYVLGKMPQNAKNSHRTESQGPKSNVTSKSSVNLNGMSEMSVAQSEEEKIAAMYKYEADQWAQQQQVMAESTPVHRGGPAKGKPINVPDHAPPSGYVCYRCGEKGHWIQACPTNDDPTFVNRPRVKRTTGIPRSFLKTVEKPTALANDGTSDEVKQPAGVMVNADGEWVIAEPDKASWDQYQAKAKVSAAAQQAAAHGDKDLQEKGLECPIDKRLFIEPTITSCCHKTYCLECITNSLLENDLRCPNCNAENILIDDLKPDSQAATEVQKYEQEQLANKKPNDAHITVNTTDPDGTQDKKSSKALSPKHSQAATKKRPAESELVSTRMLRNPATETTESVPARRTPPKDKSSEPEAPSQTVSNAPSVSAGSQMLPQAVNPLVFPPTTSSMMPMNMPQSMMMTGSSMYDPAMMANPFLYTGGNNWNMWGPGSGQQPMAMAGLGMTGGMMQNGNYGFQNNMHMPTANGFGVSSMMPNVPERAAFLNQQQNQFTNAGAAEEDSAYFRKPVNPHRHQARRNVNRPTDYREI
ncbi:MAG: hypothetical protein Q9167_003408 [Letrouitia subvulpina]